MTHYTDTPEVYPGQHEVIRKSLETHNVQRDRDRAAEARHGGRYITGALAKTLQGWGANPGLRARFAGEDGPEALAEIWRYTASPSGDNAPSSGRRTTAQYAIGQAANGGVEWAHSAYWKAPQLPEAAFDWPIYRAAIVADVYGALWGQASESEEQVLGTLAHCAGLTLGEQYRAKRAESRRLHPEMAGWEGD